MPMTEQELDAIVSQILRNDDVNIDLVPDAIESKIYRNVVRLVFGLIEESINNVKLSIFGKKISMRLE